MAITPPAGVGDVPAGPTDAELVTLALDGDQDAWLRLVQAHQEAVFRLAYLMLGDPAEAEDAAQEAFIRAFEALARFDRSRPLRPWLMRIVANQARNRRRSAGRQLAHLRRLWATSPTPVAEHNPHGMGDLVGRRWEARRLWQAVARLRGNAQEVIYLRFFMELSEAETAETLGVPPGTVKSRLHRALGHLRQVIERDFPDLRESPEAG
jgi:RNA polymerase sigma-70 factor (ECF subfamily)